MPAVATAAGLPSRLGKYELLMPLAAGGMARIYIGRSTGIGQFERHVVLKMITPERANDLTAVNMFLDEARLAASLNHQNVAQVFEVGEDSGIHYLAMEYVHGQDLRAVLAKAGSQGTRIPLELALTVVAGAAAGLHHAHERRGPDGNPLGIVHRDVSPSNIMIGYDGAVKLLDFGIAKATARSVETQSGIIKGKFAYMAPEQCRGRDVDRRSDVFSLGIILYEISTQHRCFRAESDFDTMHRIVTGDVVRPTRLVQGYPQALEAIVMKALAVDASQRYQSAGLLLEALESFAVASRMSLSTMGLGRFMRDMFGEVQEPWLNTAAIRMAMATPPRENTISSTDGKGSGAHPSGAPRSLEGESSGVPQEEGRFEDSARNEAAKTLLQLPRGRDEQPEPPQAEWNAKSYPAPVPGNQSGTYRVPPGGEAPPMPGARPTPQPHMAQPMPGEQTPGSGSGPAIPLPGGAIVSTKHGYASAAMTRGDASYPRYDGSSDLYTPAPDVHLKPNRRPLFIGAGIVLAGVVVMLIVVLGGSGPEPAAGPEPDEVEDTNERAVDLDERDPKQTGSAEPALIEDNMVSIVIHSDPPGADVLIAGAKIGVTPFEEKVKRGTKLQQLTIHKDGYVDYRGKIDLGGSYENKNIKLVPIADAKGQSSDSGEQTGSGSNAGSGSDAGSDALDEGNEDAEASASDGDDAGDTDNGEKATGGANKGGAPKSGGTKAAATKSTPKTGGHKGGGKAGGNKGGGTARPAPTPKQPACQPPGPNVDPFGPPICKS